MKKYLLLGIAIFTSLALAACSSTLLPYQTHTKQNLLKETWLKEVNTNPNLWKKDADWWFLTGDPNKTERYNHKAPPYDVISTMSVRVPNFTNIKIAGNYQVQIIGYQEHNSVYILGPNHQIRQVIVNIRHHTLYLDQAKNTTHAPLDKVIVRIGVRNLHDLTVVGSATVEGRHVSSDHLVICSFGPGQIILEGTINLAKVNNFGTGTITVMGVYTPSLRINVQGNGSVNVSGEVGVQSIGHFGDGTVSIIGANTDCLTIDATGCGLTSVAGYANLREVNARQASRVYVYWVTANKTMVTVRDDARVGLAGNSTDLTIQTFNKARFMGRYLRACNVFARSRDNSHINVHSNHKLFAAAVGNSSIYFLGSPPAVSRQNSSQSVILPIDS